MRRKCVKKTHGNSENLLWIERNDLNSITLQFSPILMNQQAPQHMTPCWQPRLELRDGVLSGFSMFWQGDTLTTQTATQSSSTSSLWINFSTSAFCSPRKKLRSVENNTQLFPWGMLLFHHHQRNLSLCRFAARCQIDEKMYPLNGCYSLGRRFLVLL